MWRSAHVLITWLMLIGFAMDHVSGFSSGDFTSKEQEACVEMKPSHGVDAMTSNCPFVAEVPTMYVPGQQLTVTLKSTDGSTFRGFMLQARRLDTMERVGEFTAATDTKQNCLSTGGKALSHDSGKEKSTLSIRWTAPNTGVGSIRFLFTIVKVKTVFWVNQTSAVMSQYVMTTPMTTTDIDTSQCGTTVSCYRQPAGCTTNCDTIVTWRKDGNKFVTFDVQSAVPEANHYISVGFSKDSKMGDDSVVDCIHNMGQGTVQMSYNKGKSNVVLNKKTLGLDPTRSSVMYKDGKLRCQFTRYIRLSDSPILPTTSAAPGISTTTASGSASDDTDKVFDLDQQYTLFVAKGGLRSTGAKMKHKDDPLISAQAISVTSGVTGDVGTSSKTNLVKVHGIMMILAWMCCVSVAIVMPRYYKKAWPGKECIGKPWWFQIHQPLMILTFFLTVIAFIIIFVSVGGYANYDSYPAKAHPPLGIVVTCLIVINPIMAAFRPHPGASKRPIFNKLHFIVGEAAHICSVAAIFISLYMVSAPSWSKWVMVAFIVWELLFELIMQLYACKTKRATSEKYEMNAVTGPEDSEARQPDNKNSPFKTFMIVLHVLVVVGLGVTIIVAIS